MVPLNPGDRIGDFSQKLAEVREMPGPTSTPPRRRSGRDELQKSSRLSLTEAIAIQRMAHILYLADLPLIPRMMTEWAPDGIDIIPGQIGAIFHRSRHGRGNGNGKIGSHVIVSVFLIAAPSRGRLCAAKASSDGRIMSPSMPHDRDGRRHKWLARTIGRMLSSRTACHPILRLHRGKEIAIVPKRLAQARRSDRFFPK
jgi:hypothetical protein